MIHTLHSIPVFIDILPLFFQPPSLPPNPFPLSLLPSLLNPFLLNLLNLFFNNFSCSICCPLRPISILDGLDHTYLSVKTLAHLNARVTIQLGPQTLDTLDIQSYLTCHSRCRVSPLLSPHKNCL